MGPCSVCYEHPPGRDAIIDAGREKSRCVEVLDTWSVCHARHRELPPLVMGAIIMTQSHSVRELALDVGTTAFTGADSAIVVRLLQAVMPCGDTALLMRLQLVAAMLTTP